MTTKLSMTEEEFFDKMGFHPEDDDLERVNCPDAGSEGHRMCGWCEECNRPRFMCMHFINTRSVK